MRLASVRRLMGRSSPAASSTEATWSTPASPSAPAFGLPNLRDLDFAKAAVLVTLFDRLDSACAGERPLTAEERAGLDDVPDDRLGVARTVSIEIVKTALSTGMWPGHTQYGRTEGPRTKSGTLASPGGSLALTDWQRQLLGLPINPAPRWNFPVGDY